MFGIARNRYDGHNAYCKECMKTKRKEHYYRDKPAHLRRNKEKNAIMRQIVLDVKNVPCSDCGVSYPGEPWLMELDHRDPTQKVSEIHQLVKNGNEYKLRLELNKCDVVCVVCHRRRTAKMFGWVDNIYLN